LYNKNGWQIDNLGSVCFEGKKVKRKKIVEINETIK
jgi:hypothetical protein